VWVTVVALQILLLETISHKETTWVIFIQSGLYCCYRKM